MVMMRRQTSVSESLVLGAIVSFDQRGSGGMCRMEGSEEWRLLRMKPFEDGQLSIIGAVEYEVFYKN